MNYRYVTPEFNRKYLFQKIGSPLLSLKGDLHRPGLATIGQLHTQDVYTLLFSFNDSPLPVEIDN